jgi:hypothetical protein
LPFGARRSGAIDRQAATRLRKRPMSVPSAAAVREEARDLLLVLEREAFAEERIALANDLIPYLLLMPPGLERTGFMTRIALRVGVSLAALQLRVDGSLEPKVFTRASPPDVAHNEPTGEL